MTTLDHLPTELISLIVRNIQDHPQLYQCALVNKTFLTTTNPLIWRSPFKRGIPGIVKAHHPVGHYVRTLNLSKFGCTDNQLLLLMKHVRFLDHLNVFCGHGITDTSFQQVPFHYPNLISLRLHSCLITQISLDALGQHCHQLRHLTLEKCSGLSFNTFSALLACPLEKLTIGPFISSGDHDEEKDRVWKTLALDVVDLTRWYHLTHLNICSASVLFLRSLLLAASTTTATTITYLKENNNNNNNNNNDTSAAWPHLTHLKLDKCYGLGDNDGIIPFLKSHPQLLHLQLSGGRFTNVIMHTIATSLPLVTFVDVSNNDRITSNGVYALVKNCLHLHNVYLDGCNILAVDILEADRTCIDGIVWGREYLKQLNQKVIDRIQMGDGGGGGGGVLGRRRSLIGRSSMVMMDRR